MLNPSSGGFVQIGWYLGETITGLPQADTPRLFFGEGGADSEQLIAGPTIGWNRDYAFKLEILGDGTFDYYYQGNLVGSSSSPHPDAKDARYLGEINQSSEQMWAEAVDTYTGSIRTLEYENPTGWHHFGDHYYSDPPFYSQSDGDIATDLVSGPGPC